VLDWADNHRIENCSVQRDVIDALMRQPHSNTTIPYKFHDIGSPISLAEYDLGKCSYAYWDTDTANYHLNTNVYTNWNQGWSYRNDGVDMEKCNDSDPAGNGYSVGWIEDNEWLQFTVRSDSAAAYQVLVRSASQSSPAIMHLELNGIDVSSQHQLPLTGSWQTWSSSTGEYAIIPAGTNKIRVYFDKGGSNVNYIRFTNPLPVNSVPFNFISGSTNVEGSAITLTLNKNITLFTAAAGDFDVKVNGVSYEINFVGTSPGNPLQFFISLADQVMYGQVVTISYSGNSIFSGDQALDSFSDKAVKNNLPRRFILPALIQAEDYNFNYGYQLENCTDVNGGQNVGFANNGDYLDYNIYVPEAGEYYFRFRVASIYSNGSISVRLGDGTAFTALKTVNFSSTGGWQTWATQVFNISLPQGNYTLRLFSLSSEYNINWFEIGMANDVNEIPGIKDLRIFPNPSNGNFFVEGEFIAGTSLIFSICDLLGNEMFNQSVERTISFSEHIVNPGWTPGIYILELSTESGRVTRKIVVM
jgi:hypothetical protein